MTVSRITMRRTSKGTTLRATTAAGLAGKRATCTAGELQSLRLTRKD